MTLRRWAAPPAAAVDKDEFHDALEPTSVLPAPASPMPEPHPSAIAAVTAPSPGPTVKPGKLLATPCSTDGWGGADDWGDEDGW